MTQMTNIIDYSCNYSKRIFTIAIDIGGSLAKVVFSPLDSNKLIFETVETERIHEFIALLHSIVKQYNYNDYKSTQIIGTGGGAFKFYELIQNEFPNIKSLSRFDEMECLIKGLNMVIHEIPDEIFTYNDQSGIQNIVLPHAPPEEDVIYPYLLVNIGSGVSILKADSPNSFKRIGGSSLGGGTLWGLLSLITGARNYDEMLDWAQKGDNTKVDMLVGDIYGSDYNNIGLKSTNIASSFAKVFQKRSIDNTKENEDDTTISLTTSTEDIKERKSDRFNNADICKSLLYAISNNIGQVAYLQAKIHNVQNIYFGGSYIRGHLTTMNTLSYAINFWSEGTKQAFFLKHEGYLGAMGAFLSVVE
ncbi:hypothetical protein Kpol_2002p20 [Vanderwaltozyma polyspora DSM 70294]|uniref:Pantothenate kinase n=1 Tax=Vanderwaltozyma polyspora (strain ATCC 22028 / DSM 70294 / BCRC 21397 / CBS 2163 / NBRC 10782 / NRRL Y-8283 / UCD 57-17) TaxID=436907 RepID=A7TFD6_VANPO|nr:uncharacterized protein Kpol_2002p20 [Vanderwaltozyma polyspora DSM 70294]EDO18950.1 hypothetical protein Kpol_2002p20 [Vanderwaltozyma polyspora DSM 70294]